MTIKNIIEEYIKSNHQIIDAGFEIFKSFKDSNDSGTISLQLIELLKTTKYNPAIGIDFARHLQLIEEKELCDQFELTDIQKLTHSLVEIQDFSGDAFVEAAAFEWYIIDDKEKAQEFINRGLESAKKQIAELERIQEEINTEE